MGTNQWFWWSFYVLSCAGVCPVMHPNCRRFIVGSVALNSPRTGDDRFSHRGGMALLIRLFSIFGCQFWDDLAGDWCHPESSQVTSMLWQPFGHRFESNGNRGFATRRCVAGGPGLNRVQDGPGRNYCSLPTMENMGQTLGSRPTSSKIRPDAGRYQKSMEEASEQTVHEKETALTFVIWKSESIRCRCTMSGAPWSPTSGIPTQHDVTENPPWVL